MNLAITNRCSRRCEFCFQKEWFLESPERGLVEMSPDLFRKITRQIGDKRYTILGGEPLLHTKIDEIMDYCKNSDIHVDMLSNISVPHDLFVYIVKTYKKIIDGWLINTDYPNEQRDLFLENLISLIDIRLGKPPNFSLGTTLLPKEGCADGPIERLSYIMKRVPKSFVPSVRIAPTTPTHNEVFKMFDFSNEIERLINALKKINSSVEFHFDCSPLGCAVSRDLTDRYANVIRRDARMCYSPLPDIMPDGKVYWCSSATFISLPNILDYHSGDEVEEALKEQWRAYWNREKLPEKCRKCSSLHPNICYGYCVATHYAIYHDHCETNL